MDRQRLTAVFNTAARCAKITCAVVYYTAAVLALTALLPFTLLHAKFNAYVRSWENALDSGDLKKVREYLRKKPALANKKVAFDHDEFDTTFPDQTPLQWAAHTNDVKLAALLLEHGARQDTDTAETGPTPLMIASETGSVEMARLLLKYDTAGINTAMKDDCIDHEKGDTALSLAIRFQRPEIEQLLRANGAQDTHKEEQRHETENKPSAPSPKI